MLLQHILHTHHLIAIVGEALLGSWQDPKCVGHTVEDGVALGLENPMPNFSSLPGVLGTHRPKGPMTRSEPREIARSLQTHVETNGGAL